MCHLNRLCYGSTTFRNILNLSVRGLSLYREGLQRSDSKDSPRIESVK